MTCYPPSHLWAYANNLHPRNDADRQTLYLQLMVEHGYVIRMERSEGFL